MNFPVDVFPFPLLNINIKHNFEKINIIDRYSNEIILEVDWICEYILH